MTESYIRVGLITDGKPDMERQEGCTLVRNLRIGDGFHWSRTISARFAGEIIPLPEPQGNIHVVNQLPLEEYVKSVAASEMNPRASSNFLMAHAVISRTWALRKIQNCRCPFPEQKTRLRDRIVTWEESDSHRGFDVCSDDHCQRYQGLPTHHIREVEDVVTACRGEVLVYPDGDGGSELADARFSKCCGGVTERFSSCWADHDPAYLVSQKDPWCLKLGQMPPEDANLLLDSALKAYDRHTPALKWTENISKADIADNVRKRYGIDLGNILHIKPTKRGPSGRIVELKLTGSRSELTVGKEFEIRRLLKSDCLRSSWFDITGETPETLTLSGRGWGHGVGLCQIGAAVMAEEGKDYGEILRFYYPGTKIHKLY